MCDENSNVIVQMYDSTGKYIGGFDLPTEVPFPDRGDLVRFAGDTYIVTRYHYQIRHQHNPVDDWHVEVARVSQ